MSSSKSPAPPDQAGESLREAFVDVCENSFFAYAENCDRARFAQLAEQFSNSAGRGPSEWLKSSVAYSGPSAGAIEIILPEQLARWLVISIAGEGAETELAEHEVFDGLGEFANMICGAWLTNLYQKQTFELRPPVVTRMTPQWTPLTDSSWNDERGHRLVINDLPVRLRLRSMSS